MNNKNQSNSAISDEISGMMEQFKKFGADILTITWTKFEKYHNGTYGIAYGKGRRRLKSILSIDREILILFTSFTELQARTVNFAKKLIDEEGARLEFSIAIIVHKDNHANNLLKNWGRNVGISVLPVYIDAAELNETRGLERILSVELFSHDPFDVAGPVSDDSQFYGRRSEAIDLARILQTGQIRTLLGIRKIGKTSMLNRIIDETRSNYQSICIMIDCSKDLIWNMSAAHLMQAISSSIKTAREKSETYSSISEVKFTTGDIIESSRQLESEILLCSTPVIIFWDEIDYITPSSSVTRAWEQEFNIFWRNFRAIYQEVLRHDSVISLMVSGVSSKWFTVPTILGIENAVLSFISDEYVSPLPRRATISMLNKLSNSAGLIFSEEVTNLIAEVCADIPYWVRKASSFVHRRLPVESRPCKVGLDDVESFIDEFVKSEGATIAQVALRHLFSVYSELEIAVDLCSEGKAGNASSFHLGILKKYGIISKPPQFQTPDSEYKLSGQMLKEGYRLYLEQEAARISADENLLEDKEDTEERLDSEWAEEIALISQRRNVIEKSLRQVVLNFIRFDSINYPNKPTTPMRVASVMGGLDKNRKLANHNAEEIIAKTTWIQLTALVEKEWDLFQRVFGDQVAFLKNREIINERYDAHAKDFDAADLALYRRSLKFFEDALANL